MHLFTVVCKNITNTLAKYNWCQNLHLKGYYLSFIERIKFHLTLIRTFLKLIELIVTHPDAGSSTDPCSNNYAGSSPASEPETQAVQAEAVRLAPSLMGFVTLHSAAYMWLHPWGHEDEPGQCAIAEDEAWLVRRTAQNDFYVIVFRVCLFVKKFCVFTKYGIGKTFLG